MGTPRSYPSYCDASSLIGEIMEQHVRRHRLLEGVSRLGLAVSGGADSVALFHLLLPLCQAKGVSMTVLHANHGLREESSREAEFVSALASEKGVACLTEELRLDEREADGNSLEMAARAARLAFFARCCGEAGLDAVATGHQADDVAETLLLRLARGAGGTGLSALRPRSPAAPALIRVAGREFAFIRPLLPFTTRVLREWLRQRGLTWHEDASNQSCEIPRNLVRNRLLPQLEAAWGETLRANLCRSADILRSDDALLEQLAQRRMKTVCADGAINIPRFKRLPDALRRRLLRQWLFTQGADDASGFESVARLIGFCLEPDSSRLQLACGWLAVICGDRLMLKSQVRQAIPETDVPLQGTVPFGGLEIVTESHRGICSEAHGVGVYPAICTVCRNALGSRPLFARPRRPGDRISPTGMAGSKKIQDLFVDAKIPEAQRDAIPIFTCGEEVVWVPGYRVSRPFRVPANDARSLRITVRPIL